MSQKLEALKDLRDQIRGGKVSDRKHSRLFFADVNGEKVFVTDARALEAIEARIAVEDLG